jgi:hypothetical protein
MVDVKTETKPNGNGNSKPVNPRDAIREKRQRRLRLVAAGKNATIKVYAANDAMREVLRHPSGLIRFRDTLDQGVEWPNDSFTRRRIAEGSVLTSPSTAGEAPPVDESLNPREQSAARKAQGAAPQNAEATESEKDPEAKPEPQRQSRPQPQPQTAE